MTPKELAERLDECEYLDEISEEDCQEAKDNKLVVVFGYSDDVVVFKGAFDGEFNSGSDETFFLVGDAIFSEETLDEDGEVLATVNAKFSTREEYYWTMTVKGLDFCSFDVCRDGDPFCKGAVFKLP